MNILDKIDLFLNEEKASEPPWKVRRKWDAEQKKKDKEKAKRKAIRDAKNKSQPPKAATKHKIPGGYQIRVHGEPYYETEDHDDAKSMLKSLNHPVHGVK